MEYKYDLTLSNNIQQKYFMNDNGSGPDVRKAKIKFISADSFLEPDKFYLNSLPSNLREESPRYIEIKKNLFWTDSYSLIPMSASIGAGTSNKKLKFRCSKVLFGIL